MKELLVKVLSSYLRSGRRGSGRTTKFLSNNFSIFRAAKIETNKGTVIADLRDPLYYGLVTYREGVTDEEIVMRKLIRTGDSVFDIGVYFGLYTALMSKLVGESGKVHSFEPNKRLLPSLRNTAAYLGNVTLHEIALSNSNGKATFYTPEKDASMSGLADWTENEWGPVSSFECEMVRLDDMVSGGIVPLPDFVKCDVEGAEGAVFEGGRSVFDRLDAPSVFFEVNPKATIALGNEPDVCLRYFESLNTPTYHLFQVVDQQLKPISGFSELIFNEHNYTNAVAIPDARLNCIR